MLGALKLFNGLCSHYPVCVFSPCLLRLPPNGGTNRFIWDRNYSIFKRWAPHQLRERRAERMRADTAASTISTRTRRRERERENSPIRQCQITQQACPSFVSTMVLLPVSICFLSAWWLMGSLEEYRVKVSRRWFFRQGCQFWLGSLRFK